MRFKIGILNYFPIVPPGQLGQEQAGSEQPQNLIWTLAGMDTEPQLLLLLTGGMVGRGPGICKINFDFNIKLF